MSNRFPRGGSRPMNDAWKNLIPQLWSWPVGANAGSPVAPATPDAEPSIDWWLRGIGQTSWVPPVSTSYTPVQEGLLASLGAQTGGGILGQLALPTEQLDPAKYWGAATARPGLDLGSAPGGNSYLSLRCRGPRTGRRCLHAWLPERRRVCRNRRLDPLGIRPQAIPTSPNR